MEYEPPDASDASLLSATQAKPRQHTGYCPVCKKLRPLGELRVYGGICEDCSADTYEGTDSGTHRYRKKRDE